VNSTVLQREANYTSVAFHIWFYAVTS